MADPVSSVAYAIEAALRALHGDLGLLLVTMGLVVAIIGVIIVNYQQLVARYPQGGGAAAAAGEAFGEAWAFIPIGALIVDFVLTIAISVSAGSSAVIAYIPGLTHWRIPLALGLLMFVAAITWFGHLGRTLFAVLTMLFIIGGTIVIIDGFTTGTPHIPPSPTTPTALRCWLSPWRSRSPWRWPPVSKPPPPQSPNSANSTIEDDAGSGESPCGSPSVWSADSPSG
ncbi:hypothetical protein ACIBG0_26750 [Nocardia sp. NPDC050630]|uniref:hypothetical protein n=1 Tax=Nocardia sp. NPDC050630 TaxID=3364321 RepID=UPI0037A3BABB